MNRHTHRLPVFGMTMAALTLSAAGEPAAAVASPAGLACQASVSEAIPQPTKAQLDAAGLGDIPLAPDSARRDLVAAPFSDSTSVTNPLFPIRELDSAILNGHVRSPLHAAPRRPPFDSRRTRSTSRRVCPAAPLSQRIFWKTCYRYRTNAAPRAPGGGFPERAQRAAPTRLDTRTNAPRAWPRQRAPAPPSNPSNDGGLRNRVLSM